METASTFTKGDIKKDCKEVVKKKREARQLFTVLSCIWTYATSDDMTNIISIPML